MKKRIYALIAAVTAAVLLIISSVTSFSGSLPSFSDVKETRWSYGPIMYAVEKGYMNGTGGGKFSPDGTLTRAMVVTVLYRREGEPDITEDNGFDDVKEGEWFTDAVSWAKESGVVKGLTETTFGPSVNISREQLATMLYRYSVYLFGAAEETADLSVFPDHSKVSVWAEDAVSWASGAGLIKGTDKGYIDPKGNATREQFAAIAERFDTYAESLAPATEADYYVSVRGDDSSDGSFLHPFRTITRAAEAVRQTEKTAEKGGITVAIRKGGYILFDFDLSEEYSGTEECPVTYTAYGDETVTVTDWFDIPADGFSSLSAGEKEIFRSGPSDSILKASLDGELPYGTDNTSFTVTCGNTELDLCRFPNKTVNGFESYYEEAADVTGKDTLTITNPILSRRAEKYTSTDGMKIHGNIAYYPYFDILSVGSYDRTTKTIKLADVTEARSYPWAGGLWYVLNDDGSVNYDLTRTGIRLQFMNIPYELDYDNEYYADAGTDSFYLYGEPQGDLHVTSAVSENGRAEYTTFTGITFEEDDFVRELEMPVFYLEKEPDKDFRILNISDPQLTAGDWEGEPGPLLTSVVEELVREESPDLITVSGDLAWGGENDSISRLCSLLDSTGIPWAPIMGNHDHQDYDLYIDTCVSILNSSENIIFDRGDPELGCGNYIIVITEEGRPVHGLIMMDTHGKEPYIDDNGYDDSDYGDLSELQIEWYGKACDMLSEKGVAETTFIAHIPSYTYNEVLAAAIKPGVDPYSVDPSEGAQTDCWAEGYEDSFGSVMVPISSNQNDNGFFDAVLEHGSTKTILCGHNHTNSFSIGYMGVRFVYSLKAGMGGGWDPRTCGGTVIEISSEGKATVRHHYVNTGN